MLKKLISFMLCALLVLQVPVVAYADSPGVTNGVGNVPYTPGGSGWNPKGSTWNDWGFNKICKQSED